MDAMHRIAKTLTWLVVLLVPSMASATNANLSDNSPLGFSCRDAGRQQGDANANAETLLASSQAWRLTMPECFEAPSNVRAGERFVSGWRPLTVADVPLPASTRLTFEGGTAVGKVLEHDTIMYRVIAGAPGPASTVTRTAGREGSYLTLTRPTSSKQAIDTLALDPTWGNEAVHLVEVRVPKGTVIWEGKAAAQGSLPGGGSQVWVSSDQLNESWFKIIPW
jgi:hypothetical protein